MERTVCYRISPELRRSAYYLLASGAPLGLIAFAVARFARNASLASAAFTGVALFLACLTAIMPLRWLLRANGQGIARRRLFRWDLWTWSDLSSGRIEKLHGLTLRDPARPWWRRRLSLAHLSVSDRRIVVQRINSCYRLPPPPEMPDLIEIRFGLLWRTTYRFDSRGIHLHGATETREYLWSEVQRVHITRFDAMRRDFLTLEVVLRD